MRAPTPTPPGPLFLLLPPVSLLFLGIAFYLLQQSLLAFLHPLLPLPHLTILLGAGLGLVAAPLLVVARRGGRTRWTLRLFPLPPLQVLWILTLGLCLLLPVWLLGEWNERLVHLPEDYQSFLSELTPQGALPWALAILGIGVVVPLGEEIVFRGILQQAARLALGPRWAILLCGTLFALLHLEPWFLAGLVLLGVVLGLVLERTGSLWAPILLHAFYNGMVLLVLAVGPGGDLPPVLTGGATGVALALLSPLGAILAFRRLRPAAGWVSLS